MKEPQRMAAVEREQDKILKVIRGPGRFVREEEERKAVERQAKKREREETKAKAAEEAVKEEEKKAAQEKRQERQKEAKKGEADSKPPCTFEHQPTLLRIRHIVVCLQRVQLHGWAEFRSRSQGMRAR